MWDRRRLSGWCLAILIVVAGRTASLATTATPTSSFAAQVSTPTIVPEATPSPPTPTAVIIAGVTAASISVGTYHACAVTTDGHAICWGSNLDSETTVPDSLGAVSMVSAGQSYTCAVKEDGSVACWGRMFNGSTPPAGLDGVTQVSASSRHTCARRIDGSVVCWGDNRSGQSTPPADLTDVAEVSTGQEYSCARQRSGSVVCWGASGFDTVPVPASLGPVVEISARYFHTCGLRADGSIDCWGTLGSDISVDPPDGIGAAVHVSAGSNHTCVIEVAGSVKCWGNDSHHQLQVPADLGAVDQVGAGGTFSCARRINGEVVCWGYPYSFPPEATPTPTRTMGTPTWTRSSCISEWAWLRRELPRVATAGQRIKVRYFAAGGTATIVRVQETIPAGWQILSPTPGRREEPGDTYFWDHSLDELEVRIPAGLPDGEYSFAGQSTSWHRCNGEVSRGIEGDYTIRIQASATSCAGDCSGDGEVTVDELLLGVRIGLGAEAVGTCQAGDMNDDGTILVNELVMAVNSALNGCPISDATPTPSIAHASRAGSAAVQSTPPDS